jgi:hypothetical protein
LSTSPPCACTHATTPPKSAFKIWPVAQGPCSNVRAIQRVSWLYPLTSANSNTARSGAQHGGTGGVLPAYSCATRRGTYAAALVTTKVEDEDEDEDGNPCVSPAQRASGRTRSASPMHASLRTPAHAQRERKRSARSHAA